MEVQNIGTFTIELMVLIHLQVAVIRRRHKRHAINTKSRFSKNNQSEQQTSSLAAIAQCLRLFLVPDLERLFPWMSTSLDLGFTCQLVPIVEVVGRSIVAVCSREIEKRH